MSEITYRRRGRKRPSTGVFIEKGPLGMVKVKPRHSVWGMIWVSPEEIEAGGRVLLSDLPPNHPDRNRPLEGVWQRVRGFAWKRIRGWKISRATYNDLGRVWTRNAEWTFDEPPKKR